MNSAHESIYKSPWNMPWNMPLVRQGVHIDRSFIPPVNELHHEIISECYRLTQGD